MSKRKVKLPAAPVANSQKSRISSEPVTNSDVFLWALFELGGGDDFVDVEAVYIRAFQLAPLRLSWRTRDDLPDLKKCSKALRRRPPSDSEVHRSRTGLPESGRPSSAVCHCRDSCGASSAARDGEEA